MSLLELWDSERLWNLSRAQDLGVPFSECSQKPGGRHYYHAQNLNLKAATKGGLQPYLTLSPQPQPSAEETTRTKSFGGEDSMPANMGLNRGPES
jgi:hypothetical protein